MRAAPHLPAAMLAEPRLARVLAMLTQAGHRALVVGGAVRNTLLGLPAEDIDLATDAAPQRVADLARAAGLKAVPTGLEHGTVTVVSGGRPFEVTTFRRDEQTDGRHAVVAFSDRLEDDAARRDFTMNALYAEPSGRVLDPTGQGLDDLSARRLRFVGEADARIAEDYLRVLRFFRFHARYGAPGTADPAALAACARGVPGLDRLSRERIGAEARKLLDAPDPSEALALMQATGVLPHVLPAEIAPLPALVAAEAAAGVPPDWQRRLALIATADPGPALRLSRAEATRHARLAQAARARPFSVDAAGYRLGADQGRDAALIAAALGADLPADWTGRLADAAAAPLPIRPADLSPPLSGPALGRGLRAAETLWIESGFSMPGPALIDAALTAGEAD